MFTYYTDWTKMVTHILFIWGVTHDRTNLKVAGSHAKINQNFVNYLIKNEAKKVI